MHERLDNLTPGQWVSSDWVYSFPYPVKTGHLQLPQDVVLCWPLVHVPYQHLSKLLGAMEVGPVTDTFILNRRKNINKEREEGGWAVLVNRKSQLILSSFPVILNGILSLSTVSLPHTVYTNTHTVITLLHMCNPLSLNQLMPSRDLFQLKMQRKKMVQM